MFCFQHLKGETSPTQKKKVDNKESDSKKNEGDTLPEDQEVDIKTDPEYEPEDVSVADESILEKSNESSKLLTENLETSPMVFQVKRKRVTELSSSTKSYYQRKFKRAKQQLKEKFAEAAASGQEKDFLLHILGSSSESEEVEEVGDDVLEMVSVHQNSDSISQILILSLINHEKYCKQKIMSLFGCSKYKVDLARKWKQQNADLLKVQKETFTRNRLDFNKCELFLDFIFQVGSCKTQHMVHKNLKFASGEKEMVQKDILIIQYSLVIGLYKEACKNVNYDALSDSSLWNITN